jgi:Fe-Mn family superoxide dismutase
VTYTLPDLPYDYAALEPAISGEIMELHHSKHHKAYVDGANTALEKMAEARDKGEFPTITMLSKNLAFHLGGHTNHSVFWQNMSPDGGDRPEGEVAAGIEEFFGSFEGFQGQFEANANTLQGSGWAYLTWDPVAQRMLVGQLYDQHANVPVGQVPLLLLDMWEHAYYLQYKNVKADYVKAWWDVVNWADVGQRLEKARSATSGLIVP